MAKSTLIKPRKPRKIPERTPDEWEYGWQSYWKKVGFTPYELPPAESPQMNQEHEFLMMTRTVERETERLARIGAEFVRGFKGLGRPGPPSRCLAPPASRKIIRTTNSPARMELADAVTYIDLLAARMGIDRGAAVALKFNRVSIRAGSRVRL